MTDLLQSIQDHTNTIILNAGLLLVLKATWEMMR